MKIIWTLALVVLSIALPISPALSADPKLGSALYDAAMFQDLPQIQALIKQGADVNWMASGRPILGWVAQNGDLPTVEALLAAGANPNIADEGFGHTPLIRAIETQKIDVVHVLLKAKANPNVVSKDGKTCLMFGVESRKPEIVQALIDAGADVKRVESDGNSPALVAAQDGMPESLEILRVLGKAGAKLDQSNIIYTPLVYAIGQGNKELTQTLLEAGANPNAKTESGKLPLVEALDTPELLEILVKAKADLNLSDSSGTALTQAVQNNNIDAVRTLLNAGADRSVVDSYGATPLQIAERNYSNEIIELLKPAPSADPALPPGAIAIKEFGSGANKCTIVDAARRQMEVHGLLQKQVDAGKMDSEIFRTFNEDTEDFGRLLTEDPSEACKLLEKLRTKYGV